MKNLFNPGDLVERLGDSRAGMTTGNLYIVESYDPVKMEITVKGLTPPWAAKKFKLITPAKRLKRKSLFW